MLPLGELSNGYINLSKLYLTTVNEYKKNVYAAFSLILLNGESLLFFVCLGMSFKKILLVFSVLLFMH